MLNPAHILETAFLLLVAFLVGATVGALAKLLFLRMSKPKAMAAATAPVVAATVVEQAALVTAPVIEPTAKPVQPAAPVEVPTPDFSEVAKEAAAAQVEVATLSEVKMPKIAALPSIETAPAEPQMAPAREAGKTTSGKQVQSPQVTDDVVAAAVVTGPGADVIPFPSERVSPVAEAAPEPVAEAAPEAATETVLEPVEIEAPAEVAEATAAVAAEPVIVVEDATEPAVSETSETAGAENATGESRTAEPAEAGEEVAVVEPVPVETTKPLIAEAAKAVDMASAPSEDETAAMRAIEGTWTPRRTPGGRATKVPVPEGVSVEDSAVVEAAAAVEAPGKPAGLPAPRGGLKDNLTNVIGILPVIETSLNSIGVFHFDQVGQFSDENVSWLEAHLGIGGRIDREHWREQARELAVISERARKVAGQH